MPAVSQITGCARLHIFVTANTRLLSSNRKGPHRVYDCHKKGSKVPAETWNYVEEFKHGTGQSQIKPQLGLPLPGRGRSGSPAAFPLVWSELMQISLSRTA